MGRWQADEEFLGSVTEHGNHYLRASNHYESTDPTEKSQDQKIDSLRRLEFGRLSDKVYVDHAGGALYSGKQLGDIFEELKDRIIGNPHSLNASLLSVPNPEERARHFTLQMLNASMSEYICIFTSGATGAIKLVAESFPWSCNSTFAFSKDNHTSILGMREIAASCGASVTAVESPSMADLDQTLCQGHHQEANNLFAYPLESNFSGARYNPDLSLAIQDRLRSHSEASTSQANQEERSSVLRICETAPSQRWWVLMDAAKGASTNPPNLDKSKPDFLVLSYYKIFGYPTGLGALVVRKEAANLLRRRYFGGGTVLACSAESAFVRRRDGAAGFEDGTNSYLGIAALPHGFSLIARLGGFPKIHARAQCLTRYFAAELAKLKHFNDRSLCELYGNHKLSSHEGGVSGCPGAIGQGPTVTCNLKRSDGSYIGYREVEKLAELNNIFIRGGCLCNPGACAMHLGLSSQDIQGNFEAGKVCWDDNDIIDGRPTGAVRISFGLSSNMADAKAVLKFFASNFLESSPLQSPKLRLSKKPVEATLQLRVIWVYPIKSCGGCRQEEWPMGPNGLYMDREWALIGEDGHILTLKKYPHLTRIVASISLETGVLTVMSKAMPQPLQIQLSAVHPAGSRIQASDYMACHPGPNCMQMTDDQASLATAWLTKAVGVKCSLSQQVSGRRKSSTRLHPSPSAARSVLPSIGFANEAQLLLVNEASLGDLSARVSADRTTVGPDNVAVERFRPNLLVGGTAEAYVEDLWENLSIGDVHFRISGPCARCGVVCVDPLKGDRQGAEPLLTLASYRRTKGQIYFGVLLHEECRPAEDQIYRSLRVGMPVYPDLGLILEA